MALAAFAAHHLRDEKKRSVLEACADMDHRYQQLSDITSVDSWLGLVAMLLKQDNDWRLTLDKRIGFPVGRGQKSAQF